MPEKARAQIEDAPEVVPLETSLHRYIEKQRLSGNSCSASNVEDVLRELRTLEDHYSPNSSSSLPGPKILPLIDFLTVYNPVVDLMVQSQPPPSVLLWGTLKAVLQLGRTSVRYHQILSETLLNITDIVCAPVQYELIFGRDPRVSIALADVYLGILSLLESLRVALSRSTFKIVRTFLRPFDVDLTEHIQRLSSTFARFEQEAALAHGHDAEMYAVKQIPDHVTVDGIISCSGADSNDMKARIVDWLSPSDYYESFRLACAKRSGNTGHWIPRNPLFQKWLTGTDTLSSRILWCYGAPGCGKTILSSTVIEYLQTYAGPVPTIYFHCSSTDKWKQSQDAINASLLAQVVAHVAKIPEPLMSAYALAKRYGRSRASASDRISDLTAEVFREISALNIIIDGIDECESQEVSGILRFFVDLAHELSSIRVMFFSRDILLIRKELDKEPSIHIGTDATKTDIDIYLRDAIHTLPSSESHLKQYVYSVLSTRAAGMFLFAKLGIETLRASVNTQEMLASLDRLPAGLHNVYSKMLERLALEPQTRQALARQVFRWVCRSTRPLSWPELQCALSWDEKEKVFDQSNPPFKDRVLDICCPLIEYRSESDSFHVAHLSIYEYLHDQSNIGRLSAQASTFIFQESTSHLELAEAALAYIGAESIAESINVDHTKYPLARYATENWCYHLSLSKYSTELHSQYNKFVSSESRRLTWITRSLLSEDLPFPIHRIAKLQKLVRTWTKQSGTPEQLQTEDLLDIQKALFRLDDYQQSKRRKGGLRNINVISNFERSMIIRDLARLYTMGGQIALGVRVFEEEVTKTGGMNSGKASKAWLLNSLGILYDQQGRFQLAEAIQRQALAVQLRFLPRDHLDIIITINELGRVCRHLQKYAEAESLHLRALTTLQTLFPNTEQHIIWTQNALARCYRKRNLATQALDLHTLAYNSMIETLGPTHPHAIWTLSDMARCVMMLGRIDKAFEMRKKVLEQRIEGLGRKHPDTLWAMNSIGLVYESMGEMSRALKLHTEAYEGQVEVFGVEHEHARWSLKALLRVGYKC